MTVPDPIITSHMVNPELSLLPPKYYTETRPKKGGIRAGWRWRFTGLFPTSPVRDLF